MHSSFTPTRASSWIAALSVGGLASWLFVANLFTQRCAIVDDAFISFRFARHLMQGEGLVWNLGEAPVEGASNLSLVVLLGLFDALSREALGMVQIADVIGAVSALGATLAIWFAVRNRESELTACLVAGLYLALPSTALHARAGLETNLYTFALTLWIVSLQRYAASPSRARLVALLLTFALTMLSRPEGGVVAGVALIAWLAFEHLVQRDPARVRSVFKLGVACAALLGAYALWKLVYFGTLRSPPYWVKSGDGGMHGLGYVAIFIVANGFVWLAFALGLLQGLRDRNTWFAASIALTNTALYLFPLPLVAFESRYLVPVLPALLIVAAPVVARLLAAAPGWAQPAFAALALVLLIPQNIHPPGTSFIELGRLLLRAPAPSCAETWTGRNRQIAQRIAQSSAALRIVAEDVGAIGYYTDAQILDPIGLTNAQVARASTARELTDIAFGFEPDLIVMRRRIDADLSAELASAGGHGALGRFGKSAVFGDPRFTAYRHIGEGDDGDPVYRWHFWARASSPHAAQLERLLASYEQQKLD